jgi:MoxR-like ATPase
VRELRDRVVAEVAKVVVGQDHVVDVLLAATTVGGHVLLEGVPGVAKTLLANAFARALGVEFRRVQFTPDMLPSDLTGTMTLRTTPSGTDLVFRPGPVFANLVLADEINRTTPKTQSALLEAMNEAQITVDNRTHPLPQPFFVIGTQNPIEHHGTYPLPESQLDRFLMRIRMGYPSRESEKEIIRTGSGESPAEDVEPQMNGADLIAMQDAVRRVAVDDSLLDYALEIVERTRTSEQLTLGVSPRGMGMLHRAAQARAFLHGRDYCVPDDFKRLIVPVFAHRVMVSSRYVSTQKKSAQAETILAEILETTHVPL